jgi:hypothetical protein
MTRQLRPLAQWSSAVEEAQWIAERLDGFAERVTSIVPHGFDAYCRILHPVYKPAEGERLVRWRDVAQWSGIDLRPMPSSTPSRFRGSHRRPPRPGEARAPTRDGCMCPTPKW